MTPRSLHAIPRLLAMRYVSTRASDASRRVYTFEDAVLSGWAEDGGMILPHPADLEAAKASVDLDAWAALDFKHLSVEVLRLFAGQGFSIDDAALRAIVDDAFASFEAKGDVVDLKQINVGGRDVTVAELFHGPTLAFKDIGMQCLVGLQNALLQAKGERRINLVGTSGDTGAATIEATKGKDCVCACVLYPSRKHSNMTLEQEMVTTHLANEPNICAIKVRACVRACVRVPSLPCACACP